MKDGKTMLDLQLVFVQTTTIAAGGTVERASSMVKVVQATPGTEYRLIHASEIDGAGHLIPFDPDRLTVNGLSIHISISKCGMRSQWMTKWMRIR